MHEEHTRHLEFNLESETSRLSPKQDISNHYHEKIQQGHEEMNHLLTALVAEIRLTRALSSIEKQPQSIALYKKIMFSAGKCYCHHS